MCVILISKVLRLAHVNKGSQSFTCHVHIYPNMEQTILSIPQPQGITALWPVRISRPTKGRRLSWPRWLGEIPRWFVRQKAVTHPSSGQESKTRDHGVGSLTPWSLDYQATHAKPKRECVHTFWCYWTDLHTTSLQQRQIRAQQLLRRATVWP